MEFLDLVVKHQERRGMSSEELSSVTGIGAYTLYNLLKHRVFLTKPMYFALCAGMGFTPDLPNLDNILARNKEMVRLQSSNVDGSVLEESFERVHVLEKELHDLQLAYDGTLSIRGAYSELQEENRALREELAALKASMREEIAQAERRGAVTAGKSIAVSQSALESRAASERMSQLMRSELMSAAEQNREPAFGATSAYGIPKLTVADLLSGVGE